MQCCTRRSAWLALAALASLTAVGWPDTPSPGPTSQDAAVVLRFHNGSVIQPAVLLDALEIETKFGKVSIPASEIRGIDFAFRLTAEDTRKLEQALRDLGNNKHKIRDAAQKTLRDMGRLAYPALRGLAKGSDLETTRRVEALLKEIKARVPEDRLKFRRQDIVRTTDSTVAGQIIAASLRLRCELFGEMKVPVAQMRDLRSLLPGGNVLVAVVASKNGNRTTWMETGFEVTADTRLEIRVTGEINLDPRNQLGNPALTQRVRPDGNPNFNVGDFASPGTLLGRIGQDGPPFVVGSRYSGTPNREGKLFLRIVTFITPNNVRAEGSYQVNISPELE